MSDETKETFEVQETEGATATLPTREEAKAEGLTAAELERAEKHGLVAKPEEPEQKAADEKAKADADAKAKAEADAKAAEDAAKTPERRAEDKLKSSLPDFSFKTPEQEKAFLDAFGPGHPQRAMYFRMKNERQAKQAERAAREAVEKERDELRNRIKALESKVAPELDDNGDPIDPDSKPLTRKDLLEIQKKEAEEKAEKERELNTRAQQVAEAHRSQEEFARSVFPDFDKTVELVGDLLQNLDTLVPEPWKQARIAKLSKELQIAAANADKLNIDEDHAAMIAYELGKYHPKYGKHTEPPAAPNGVASDKDGKPENPTKANGSLTPGQIKRLEGNTQKGASSASITGGGGSRTISADDVDAATLDKMSYSARQKFREKHPDRYAKLLRG